MKDKCLSLIALLFGCGAVLAACGSDDTTATGTSGSGGSGGGDLDGSAGDSSAGSSGTGGTAGASGTAGSGGTAGSSGTGGAAGSAGAGASAGSAGTAGASGAAGSPPACTNAADCSDSTAVCDPATRTCAPSTCDPADYQSCPDFPQSICLEQANGHGACYVDCTPFQTGTGCEPGSDCLVQSDDESLGLCFGQGPAAVGASCDPTDTTTACVAGAVCANLGTSTSPDRRCIKTCQVFSDEPTGCPTGELCMVGSVCLSPSIGIYDPAGIGQPCTLDDYYFCGEVAGRLTGTCDDAPSGGTELICYTWCRLSQGTSGSPDCPSGFSCTDTDWGNGMGVCVQD